MYESLMSEIENGEYNPDEIIPRIRMLEEEEMITGEEADSLIAEAEKGPSNRMAEIRNRLDSIEKKIESIDSSVSSIQSIVNYNSVNL